MLRELGGFCLVAAKVTSGYLHGADAPLLGQLGKRGEGAVSRGHLVPGLLRGAQLMPALSSCLFGGNLCF